ncbi:MAG: hypothetical protein JWO82_3705 [Akkermansiaceae bacterium]|nr:hypothetical protein [Akkermansiaceae bacterium]
MKERKHEDAVLRSLGILPDRDAANSDPSFLKNPELTAEARTARETVVDTWLAVSPLQVAPPGILEGIMTKVRPKMETATPRRRITWPLALAATGWAAALALGLMLVNRENVSRTLSTGTESGERHSKPERLQEKELSGAPVRTGPTPSAADRKMQDEIARLKRSIEEQESHGSLPRVRGLAAPGMVAATPEKARDDLRRVLVDALRSSLEAETGAPGDPAALVIERGWLPAGFPPIEDSQIIRHRHFPEEDYQQYGLMKTGEDTYYDSSNKLIWERDPDSRGFIGRKAAPTDKAPEIKTENADPKLQPQKSTVPQKLAQNPPSGILIEDPDSRSATAVVEGVAPASEGTSQVAVFTLSSGQSVSLTVNSSMFSSSGTLMIPMSVDPAGVSLGVSNFQLQTRNNAGAVIETLIQGLN